MAISRKKKEELVEQYQHWLTESDGLILTRYHQLSVKDIGTLRGELRKSGGEFHIIKNTLAERAFQVSGLDWDEGMFDGPTALGISFEDPSAMAKAIKDFASEHGTIEIKSGYLDERLITIEEINQLAELPSMDEMRAKLLATLQAPASKLVRTLAEPAPALAPVPKKYSEEGAAA